MALTFFFSLPCRAWEADVHKGLTEWLALKAGFSPKYAKDIADANQRQDELSDRDAVQLVIWDIIADTRQHALRASKDVQKFHFPSGAHIPGSPKSREVKPGDPEAHSIVANARNLQELGEALHAYQDSWSHQGIPDIPIGFPKIREDLSWGHPETRGSWYRHKADLTPVIDKNKSMNNVVDTINVARETYSRLLKFPNRNKYLGENKPVTWPNLQSKVREFAKADTKAKKRAWFQEHASEMVSDLSFLDGINLPYGSLKKVQSLPEPQPSIAFASLQLQQPSNYRQEIANDFLNAWIVNQGMWKNLEKALAMIDFVSLEEQLRGWDTSEHSASQWASKFLTMWLLGDHGEVEKLGHGYPAEKAYIRLPTNLEQAVSAGFAVRSFSSLDEAIKGAGENGSTFDIVDIENCLLNLPNELHTFGVAFQFEDLPYDALLVVMGRVSSTNDEQESWKVVRLLWAVL